MTSDKVRALQRTEVARLLHMALPGRAQLRDLAMVLRARSGRAGLTEPSTAESIALRQVRRGQPGWVELRDVVTQEGVLFDRSDVEVQELLRYLGDIVTDDLERGEFRDRLVAVVRARDLGEFRIAYGYALDIASVEHQRAPDSFHACVDVLLSRQHDAFDATFRFVEWYCRLLPPDAPGRETVVERLRRECDAMADRCGYGTDRLARVRRQVAGAELTVRPHLLFHLDDRTTGGWTLWSYNGGWVPPVAGGVDRQATLADFGENSVVSRDQLCRALTKALGTRLGPFTSPAAPPVVEFMAPWSWLDSGVEELPVTTDAGEDRLGRLAPLVVRPLPCSVPPQPCHYDRWRHAHNGGNAIQYLQTDEAPIDQTCAGLAICYVPTDREKTLSRIGAAGVPVAVWSRTARDPYHVLNGWRLVDLIDRFWERRKDPDQADFDLVLLWDDPHWVFEGKNLIWRPA